MFPWVFEWQYEIGHFALLGAWYGVLTAIGIGLIVALLKTAFNLRKGGGHHEGGHEGGHH